MQYMNSRQLTAALALAFILYSAITLDAACGSCSLSFLAVSTLLSVALAAVQSLPFVLLLYFSQKRISVPCAVRLVLPGLLGLEALGDMSAAAFR